MNSIIGFSILDCSRTQVLVKVGPRVDEIFSIFEMNSEHYSPKWTLTRKPEDLAQTWLQIWNQQGRFPLETSTADQKYSISERARSDDLSLSCQTERGVMNFRDDTLLMYTNKKCSKCGTVHEFRNCPAFGKKCMACGKQNHFARCCHGQDSSKNISTKK